jgi:hypothetical protein
MATCQEKMNSRRIQSGDKPSVELLYVVTGTDNEATATSLVEAATPSGQSSPLKFILGALVLYRESVETEPVYVDEGETTGCVWFGTVTYTPTGLGSSSTSRNTEPKEELDASFSFEIGVSSQRITQSIATIASYGGGGDFGGAIGVTSNGVEGVDISVPVYTFTETHYFPVSAVTNSYKQKLMSLTGKVNLGGFAGFEAGEVMFQGCSASRRGDDRDDLWEITFKFAVSQNDNNITVGDITGISKKGWEYLWVRYAEGVDEVNNVPISYPVGAYVEQVYKTASFGGLGIRGEA